MIETRNRIPLATESADAEWSMFATVPRPDTGGCRIYAIGDVHGHADHLAAMHAAIGEDMRRHPAESVRIIHLGDLVDRGPASAAVIELVLAAIAGAPEGVKVACLMGNHDHWMLGFLENAGVYEVWGPKGGFETVASYGLAESQAAAALTDPAAAEALRAAFAALVPLTHKTFLRSLPLWLRQGDYFFVHAGIDPDRPLQDQSSEDLMWIRDRFLASRKHHGPVVVHGHTPRAAVESLPNRINVDTGIYLRGRLSCVVLEGTERHLLEVSQTAQGMAPVAHQLTEGQNA